jgi:hypothetical protein
VLLIDSFVMTTLFYPALALQIQWSSRTSQGVDDSYHPAGQEDPFSLLSTPWIDYFFPFSSSVIQLTTPTFFWDARNVSGDEPQDWTVRDHTSGDAKQHGDGVTAVDLVAAPIAWTNVDRVIASTRMVEGNVFGQTQHEQAPADIETVSARIATVLDNLRSDLGMEAVECLEAMVDRPACLDSVDVARSTAVAYFKVARKNPYPDYQTFENAWQAVNRAIPSNEGGAILDLTQVGTSSSRSRLLSIYVSDYNCLRTPFAYDTPE